MLNQDLRLIENIEGALDRLIENLRRDRGDLRIQPDDFLGWSQGTRFYPLLYMLTRVWRARDWESGDELSAHLLGHLSRPELHHIFPKKRLYEFGYSRPEANALANFTFVTQETNLRIGAREPEDYLEEIAVRDASVLESHWIPMDRDLWKVESYPQFLDARRALLADAANEFLDSLCEGHIPERAAAPTIFERPPTAIPGSVRDEQEEQIILECAEWVAGKGLPDGELLFEVVDPETGELLAVADLAWPDGLQPGLSQPVALLIAEDNETERIVSKAGFRCFTDAESLRSYVTREIVGPETEAA